MLAKSQAEQGDWLVRNDTGSVWIMTGSNPASLSSWTQLEYPVAPVTSVAGRTGDIVLAKADVGLGNVDNTSDAAKPVSTAQATAIAAKADATALTAHTGRTDNPHGVTKAQVGLSNVDNTSDAAKPVSTAQQAAINTAVSDLQASVNSALTAKASTSALSAHTGDLSNPHNVTKAQVGLGNVDNTSDAAKPVSTAQAAAIGAKLDAAQKGAANGVAPLDASSKVPSANMPDVIEGIIQVRSGLDTDVGTAVLARDALLSARELAWDESRKGFRLGDGSTPGGELVNGIPVPRTINTTAWDANQTANGGAAPRLFAEMDSTLGIPLMKFPQAAGGQNGVGLDNGALRVVTGDATKDFSLSRSTVNNINQGLRGFNFLALPSGFSMDLSFVVSTTGQHTLFLTHTATLASLTLILPNKAFPTAELRIVFTAPVTALTLSLGTASLLADTPALPTSATAGMDVVLIVTGVNGATYGTDGRATVTQWARAR